MAELKTLDEFTNMLYEGIRANFTGISEAEKKAYIVSCTRNYIDDILKTIKNINTTSLPGNNDRFVRIIHLEEKFGIPKRHLL